MYCKDTEPATSPIMRDGKWKFHLKSRHTQKIELYDLSVDPSESQNLADKYPDVAAKLSAKLKAWITELPAKYEKVDKRKDGKKGKRKI